MIDERWFTVAEIATLLQVHEETVRQWLRVGRLKGRNFGGRTGYRVRETDLTAFLLDEASDQATDAGGKAAA